ncbi:MAG: hypothetical protein AAF600_21545 [Bacteroidota bacterium]
MAILTGVPARRLSPVVGYSDICRKEGFEAKSENVDEDIIKQEIEEHTILLNSTEPEEKSMKVLLSDLILKRKEKKKEESGKRI